MDLVYDLSNPIQITLDWCPSVNHYWLTHKNYKYISKRGKDFRRSVAAVAKSIKEHNRFFDDKLLIQIVANPPDRRKRDLDNLLKAPLDALQSAGLYKDDSQIEEIRITRGFVGKPGSLAITLWRCLDVYGK